jgi:hypothetical protein
MGCGFRWLAQLDTDFAGAGKLVVIERCLLKVGHQQKP